MARIQWEIVPDLGKGVGGAVLEEALVAIGESDSTLYQKCQADEGDRQSGNMQRARWLVLRHFARVHQSLGCASKPADPNRLERMPAPLTAGLGSNPDERASAVGRWCINREMVTSSADPMIFVTPPSRKIRAFRERSSG